jgi:hypothetical protein
MWNLLNCYISGRHDYGVWCEPGEVFLRCLHCGKRSVGWSIARRTPAEAPAAAVTDPKPTSIVPFPRIAAH